MSDLDLQPIRDEVAYAVRSVAARYRMAGEHGDDLGAKWINTEIDRAAQRIHARYLTEVERLRKAEAETRAQIVAALDAHAPAYLLETDSSRTAGYYCGYADAASNALGVFDGE